MTEGHSDRSRAVLPEPPAALTWRSWPLVDARPWPLHGGQLWPPPASSVAAWVPYALPLLAGLLTGWATADGLKAVAAACVVLACLWRWLVPATYEANSQGLSIQTFGRRRRIPWGSVGYCEFYERGLVLLPAKRSWLERFRGIYVPFDPEKRLPTVARYYLEPWLETP